MARPNGGWISGYAAPADGVARGVWSLRDALPSQIASPRQWPQPSKDPFFANVQLLLHGEGASIVDTSSAARTVTASGGAAVSSTRARFGTQSITIPSSSAVATVPRAASILPGSSDFTIEVFCWPTTLSGFGSILYGCAVYSWAMYVNNGAWSYYLSTNGTAWNLANGVVMGTPVAGAWNHLALVRSGSTFSPFVNGVRGTTVTSSAAIAEPSSTVGVQVGATGSGSFGAMFLDAARVTIGTARYSGASFIVPKQAFQEQ